MRFKLKILYYLLKIKFEKLIGLTSNKFYLKRRKKRFLKNLKKSNFYNQFSLEFDDFSSLPIMNKSIFMKNFNGINTCGISYEVASDVANKAEESRDFSPMINNISVGLSTGTSGNRGMFLVNESERAYWVALMIDRVIGFSFKNTSIAFFLRANNKLYESTSSKKIDFNFFDIYLDFNTHIERLNNLQPNILIAQPSVLMLLSKKQETGSLQIKPNKIISVAEVLTPEDKTYFENVFKVRVDQVYQCTEGFLASTCSEGVLHFNEDFLIIEKKYIDNKKTKFHPIITDLLRKTQPIVRYELNDIVVEKSNCKCGSPFMAIESIEGRSDDIITFLDEQMKEVSIFPDVIRRTIVLSDDRISDYVFVQSSSNQINLYIGSDFEDSYSIAETALSKKLNEYHIQDFKINRIKNSPHKLGDKKRRVINDK